MASKPVIDKIEPPFWWTGMACDTLQLMVYGNGIRESKVTIDYPGVSLLETIRPDSPNYLFLYLNITGDTKPGQMQIKFTQNNKSTTIPYSLKPRTMKPEDYKGFDASDVLYLIMPDRFAKGTAETCGNYTLQYNPAENRKDPNARHGGNISGLRDILPYIDSLGVTAVWVNPVLTNDMPDGSYHGYATTDYYNIDPRFGSNREWNDFIADAQSRGIKVVMDMIFNHSGSNHPWFKDMPTKDWYNFPDKFVQTNFRLTTIHDPYVSNYDRRRTVDGWFVEAMPDLNQRNPHLMKYLIQNSIWWIEESKINGIRMDTYPYADMDAMASWIKAVEREYPGFNIVGECWYNTEGSEAFWQRNSYVNRHANPELPTVMDFIISIKARDAFSSQTGRLSGLNEIYDHLSLDFLFPDPQKILTFLDNHDTDRFLSEIPDSLGWWKQAMAFLLTSRGIPQIYYGTEILMNGSREKSDGNVRKDFPGGFPGDTIDAFSHTGRTDIQNEAHDFLQKLLNWRKGNKVISEGSLKHFMPENGIYVYQRSLDGKNVTVIMNGNDTPVTTTMERTLEILPYGSVLHDIISDTDFTVNETMTFPPRALYILEN